MKTQSNYSSSKQLFTGIATELLSSRLELQLAGLPEKKAYAVWADVTATLKNLDKIFNPADSQSELSLVNSSKVDIETSDTFREALNLCESYLITTGNLFDVSLGGRDELDFGGFVKGYALRSISAILKSHRVKDAFVDFGHSNYIAIGKKPYADCWKVEIYNPDTDDLIKEYELSNASLSITANTSEYSGHIINPLTRKADETPKMSAVLCKDPLDADVLSLVLFIASANQKADILRNYPAIVNEEIAL